MIPKIIHYVWLGGGKMTPFISSCVDSWKNVMPDYQLKCWDENNFDIESVPWVKEAIEKKKWSLASDYIRHYAIYTEGGIYMDTDVKVFRSFDNFLSYDFFSSIEFHPTIFQHTGRLQVDLQGYPHKAGDSIGGLGILAALFGASPGNPFIKECLDFFGNRHFVRSDGSLFVENINPDIMATIAVKYGFLYKDEKQYLKNNMVLFDSSVFCGDRANFHPRESYAMHYCDGSWRDNKTVKVKVRSFLRNWLLKR